MPKPQPACRRHCSVFRTTRTHPYELGLVQGPIGGGPPPAPKSRSPGAPTKGRNRDRDEDCTRPRWARLCSARVPRCKPDYWTSSARSTSTTMPSGSVCPTAIPSTSATTLRAGCTRTSRNSRPRISTPAFCSCAHAATAYVGSPTRVGRLAGWPGCRRWDSAPMGRRSSTDSRIAAGPSKSHRRSVGGAGPSTSIGRRSSTCSAITPGRISCCAFRSPSCFSAAMSRRSSGSTTTARATSITISASPPLQPERTAQPTPGRAPTERRSVSLGGTESSRSGSSRANTASSISARGLPTAPSSTRASGARCRCSLRTTALCSTSLQSRLSRTGERGRRRSHSRWPASTPTRRSSRRPMIRPARLATSARRPRSSTSTRA